MGIFATADASSIGGILDMATQLLTWVVTSMGSIITFITSNPIILIMLLVMLVGLAVGMLFRIWHSAG